MPTPHEKRSTYVQIRATESEKRAWKALADARSEPLSDVVRMAMKRIPPERGRLNADD